MEYSENRKLFLLAVVATDDEVSFGGDTDPTDDGEGPRNIVATLTLTSIIKLLPKVLSLFVPRKNRSRQLFTSLPWMAFFSRLVPTIRDYEFPSPAARRFPPPLLVPF